MTELLTDAAAVGNATARALVFRTREPESFYFESSAWKTGFIGGSHEFEFDGERLLDGRTMSFYGPLEPWFDREWQPGELERLDDIPAMAASAARPRMATDIPAPISTPDRVETRIGTLEFFDGFPTEETTELVYDPWTSCAAWKRSSPGSRLLPSTRCSTASARSASTATVRSPSPRRCARRRSVSRLQAMPRPCQQECARADARQKADPFRHGAEHATGAGRAALPGLPHAQPVIETLPDAGPRRPAIGSEGQ